MAESNATQVILTDDGLKIIKAQDTANEAVGNVNDINSDNKLTPSEKIKLKQEYDKDSKLYAIDVSQLQSVGLPTTELETAMSNLTNFVTPLFEEMYITSTIDRDTLNSIFTAFATADKNASQAFVNMVQQVADDAKKVGDDAKEAGEKAKESGEAAKQAANQAQADATKAKSDAATAQQKAQSSIDQLNETSAKFDGEITEAKTSASQAQSAADNAFSRAQTIGSQATSAIAIQSAATAKAQSAADNALSSASSAVAKAESTASEFGKVSQKADSAFDNALSAQNDASSAVAQASSAAADSKDAKQIAGAVSQSYKTLTDGSTMTIAELQSGLAVKLTKTDLNGYATQDWAQNKIKMTADGINGTMSGIKSTVDGQTTSINDLKADSSSFKSQFTTVNDTIGKHTTDIGTLKSTSNELTTSFNTLTTDNNTNKNDISQLKQTSKEVSSTLETVQTQVQNSAVGTNLLTGTAKCEFPLNNNGGIQTIQKYDDGTNYIQHTSDTPNDRMGTWWPLTPELGQVYTLSADVCGNGYIQGDEFRYEGGDNGSLGRVDLTDGWQRISNTFHINTIGGWVNWIIYANNSTLLKVKHIKVEKGSLATDWCPNPADIATQSQITQLSGEIEQKVNSGDFSTYKTQTAELIGSKVDNGDFSTYKTQTANLIGSKVANSDFSTYKTQTAKLIESRVDNGTYQSDKTQTADLISQTVKKNDVVNQINISNEGILIDGKKVHITGNTSIDNAVIKNAMIANAAINTAQIANGAINNAKIANAAINDAKIANLNGNKIIAGSITSKQLNADDIIANVINGKTINGITINTPNLNLGTNGVLNENWNLNQNTGWFQPKKGIGTTTLDTGVLRMNGNLSRWWDGSGSDQYWYGIGDNGDKIKNGSNSVTDDYAPGYEKHDIVGSSGVLFRSYLDATGLYLNQNSTKTVMVALTQKGLDTGGYIHAQQNSVVDQWFDAGVDRGTGIRIGYRAIQAHGSNDIYFNTDSTVGALTLHAKNFATSSQLSRKKDISPLEEEQAMETIMNADIYRYHYKDETESEPYSYSVIIDDIHEKPQYKTPEEFIIADRTGRNDGNAVGFLIQALKNANRRISALEEIVNERK